MGTGCLNTDINFSELKTPCYIVDVERLDRNIASLKQEFRDVWKDGVIYGYSIKTNSLPWLITHMKHKRFFAEVVSEQEYKLARKLGFQNKEIILNGPIKSTSLLVEALNGGSIVNIDNQNEIDKLEECIDRAKDIWKVGLRYNFQLESECPGETIVGGEYSRFGFCVENGEFERACERIKGINGIKISGLHGHNSTKSKSLNVFKAIASEAAYLNDRCQLDIEYLDIGGGFFGDKLGKPTFAQYSETISRAFGKHTGIKLIIEPGASLVSSPISYLCEVKNIRTVIDKSFVTVDGSCIHVDPMMHGIGFIKSVHRNSDACNDIGDVKSHELCGFTCIEMDRMGIIDEEVHCGDRIEFFNCGSYSMTLAPLFIAYFPRVYIKRAGKYTVVRDAWDEGDFVRKCEVSQ